MISLAKLSQVIFGVGLICGFANQSAVAEESLPSLSLNTEQVTLSGLSSGGFMANQMHLAYSEWVSGVGLIATGPFYCAQNSLFTALASCINKTEPAPNVSVLNNKIREMSDSGDLGSLDQLKRDKVWLLSGTKDTRVIQSVADKLYEQYTTFIDKSDIVYIKDKPFAHHFPTVGNGSDCSISEAPFVGNCGYDTAGNMLKHLLPQLNPKAQANADNLYTFTQTELAGELAKGLGDMGYVYIPSSCQQGDSCQVHINFHGCNQYADAVGTQYIEQNGLNDWAESNKLIVLYPQTKKSSVNPLNPQGCWDWWGYTDRHYATRQAIQIKAVKQMVLSLTETHK